MTLSRPHFPLAEEAESEVLGVDSTRLSLYNQEQGPGGLVVPPEQVSVPSH